MTALAMIIGMIPMALGLGESGEQNAPLGRAVIGGLIFATVATLFFVPTVFVMVHGRKPAALNRSGETQCLISRHRPTRRRLADARLAAIRVARGRRRAGARGLGNSQPCSAPATSSARDGRLAAIDGGDGETAVAAATGDELVLPGIVQAYIESPIYARTNGYLSAGTPTSAHRCIRVSCWRKSTPRRWTSS